jgi:16S rRNA (cytosine967-C5)-methyltransferase
VAEGQARRPATGSVQGGAGGGAAGPPDARALALAILVRVERGAYAAPLVDRALTRLARRDDRSLCTELVYGTLRWQGRVDHALSALMRQPLERLPAPVRAALRLGAYQLVGLTRVPAHAAVSTSVRLVRDEGFAGLSGVVNAVLRRLAREGAPPLPADEVARLAVDRSHPRWLVAMWLAQYGRERALRLMDHDNTPAPVTARVRADVGRERLIARWREAGVEAVPTVLSPHGLRLTAASAVAALPGYADGEFVVQDEGAMLAVDWLGVAPGQRVVDACAGRGAKTLGLLDAIGEGGAVLAVDIHAHKLGALRREAHRRGYRLIPGGSGADTWSAAPGLATVAADARALARLTGPGGADRILLDAPCTGLGVLRRRPELRWRRRPDDAPALAALQTALLEAACDALAPAGEVLYVTCTTDPRENEAVVARVLAARRDVEALAALPAGVVAAPGVEVGPLGTVRLFGPETGTDGFFYARLRRRRPRPRARAANALG